MDQNEQSPETGGLLEGGDEDQATNAAQPPNVNSSSPPRHSKRLSYRLKQAWKTCYMFLAELTKPTRHWFQRMKRAIVEKWMNWIVVHKLREAFPGWELGVAAAIGVAMFTLSLNFWFLIAVSTKHKARSNGLGTLWEDNCHKVAQVNKVLHGVINVLSTILIAQSNFCMQLLASPTRLDIDAAHKRRRWMDIGIPSIRNVWQGHISNARIALWILLALGSIPLHLLWNSVIIFSPIAYEYNQILVTEGFTRGLPVSNPDGLVQIQGTSEGPGGLWPGNLRILQEELKNYEKLDNDKCKKSYAQFFVQDRSDVIVVTKSTYMDTNTSVVLGGNSAGWGPWPYKWLCPAEARENLACSSKLFNSGNNWTFSDFANPTVDYCLSKREENRCRLEYGFLVTVLTVAANALKFASFAVTYWLLKRNTKSQGKSGIDTRKMQPLVTTGDAVSSFLEFEDKETRGMSIVEKEDFKNGIWSHRWVQISPMQWRQRFRCCRFRAIGVRRWMIDSFLLLAIPLYPAAFLLTKKQWLEDLGLNKTAIRDLGLGNPSGLFLFGAWNGNRQIGDYQLYSDSTTRTTVLRNIALANTPQLVLSIAFYIWNSHLTVMTAARDYNEFAVSIAGDAEQGKDNKPKHGLRVTYPQQGTDQREAYFFAIPFKYWALVTVLWTILHWLASQAIFFARVDLLNYWLEVTELSISQVGYSVLGMICVLVVAVMIFLLGLFISIKSIPNRMPLAATCSAALSAACHPKNTEFDHHTRKVHWGVEMLDEDASPNDSHRCTFTSGEARYPSVGQFYA